MHQELQGVGQHEARFKRGLKRIYLSENKKKPDDFTHNNGNIVWCVRMRSKGRADTLRNRKNLSSQDLCVDFRANFVEDKAESRRNTFRISRISNAFIGKICRKDACNILRRQVLYREVLLK